VKVVIVIKEYNSRTGKHNCLVRIFLESGFELNDFFKIKRKIYPNVPSFTEFDSLNLITKFFKVIIIKKNGFDFFNQNLEGPTTIIFDDGFHIFKINKLYINNEIKKIISNLNSDNNKNEDVYFSNYIKYNCRAGPINYKRIIDSIRFCNVEVIDDNLAISSICEMRPLKNKIINKLSELTNAMLAPTDLVCGANIGKDKLYKLLNVMFVDLFDSKSYLFFRNYGHYQFEFGFIPNMLHKIATDKQLSYHNLKTKIDSNLYKLLKHLDTSENIGKTDLTNIDKCPVKIIISLPDLSYAIATDRYTVINFKTNNLIKTKLKKEIKKRQKEWLNGKFQKVIIADKKQDILFQITYFNKNELKPLKVEKEKEEKREVKNKCIITAAKVLKQELKEKDFEIFNTFSKEEKRVFYTDYIKYIGMTDEIRGRKFSKEREIKICLSHYNNLSEYFSMLRENYFNLLPTEKIVIADLSLLSIPKKYHGDLFVSFERKRLNYIVSLISLNPKLRMNNNFPNKLILEKNIFTKKEIHINIKPELVLIQYRSNLLNPKKEIIITNFMTRWNHSLFKNELKKAFQAFRSGEFRKPIKLLPKSLMLEICDHKSDYSHYRFKEKKLFTFDLFKIINDINYEYHTSYLTLKNTNYHGKLISNFKKHKNIKLLKQIRTIDIDLRKTKTFNYIWEDDIFDIRINLNKQIKDGLILRKTFNNNDSNCLLDEINKLNLKINLLLEENLMLRDLLNLDFDEKVHNGNVRIRGDLKHVEILKYIKMLNHRAKLLIKNFMKSQKLLIELNQVIHYLSELRKQNKIKYIRRKGLTFNWKEINKDRIY